MKQLILFFPFLLLTFISIAQSVKETPPGKIIVRSEIPINFKNHKKVEFKILGVGYFTDPTPDDSIEIRNGIVKWERKAEAPVKIKTPLFGKRYFNWPVLEPGDNISIAYVNGKVTFSGTGFEKFQLETELGKLVDSLTESDIYRNELQNKIYKINSTRDYILWNSFLDKKAALLTKLIDSYKSKISPFAYKKIKVDVLSDIENARVDKFLYLKGKVDLTNGINSRGEIVNTFGLSNRDLLAIFDSTLNNPSSKWLLYQVNYVNNDDYIRHRVLADSYREKGKFFREKESDTSILGSENVDRFVSVYNTAKKNYSGMVKEAYLASVFWNARGAFHYCGFIPEIEGILADYYAQSNYPEYMEEVKRAELKYRERYNRKYAANFTLMDVNGKTVTKDILKNKVAIVDFWFTGCLGCMQMVPSLRNVEEHFKNDTNVIFLSISIDKDKEKWLKSLNQKKYTSGLGINLYTGGHGKDHEMIKKYGVTGYPTIYLIDPFDKVTWSNKIPDPRKDNGRSLISLIQSHLTNMKDGPYIFYSDNDITSYSIYGKSITNTRMSKNVKPSVKVQTDKFDLTFTVSLKDSLRIPPSVYSKPDKMMVLSDIEGKFDAFRKLLQTNKIIDENYNWIFGDGHLVFAGDMFDRGLQVTECLWLIYSLEEKAEAAGGYVHFILGNHEIMNLLGNDSYVQQKYFKNAVLMNKSLIELYNEESELGRWLRTKNVVEKIGDLLLLHGGISRKLNHLPVTIEEINKLARPYYSVSRKDYGNEKINVIMSTSTGPFWYRGYYNGKVPESVIDSTLQKFNVSRIITGHTIVADTISAHYNKKIINTDTKHAEGKSEALLIEKQKYYRVNAVGERKLLFVAKSNEHYYKTLKQAGKDS